MKKQYYILFYASFLFLQLSMNAQNSLPKIKNRTHFIGLQTRIIDVLPIELSYVSLQPKKISFQTKIGLNFNTRNEMYDVILYNNLYNTFGQASNNLSFKHEQYMKAIYMKGGIFLRSFSSEKANAFFALNFVWAYANEIFKIETSDKIYGKTIQIFTENNIYNSIEFEVQKIYNSGISLGLMFGYKISKPDAFSSIVKNLENASTYSPGQGFGKDVYFNLQVGYHFKIKK